MADLAAQLADLSPERRLLLEKILRQQEVQLDRALVVRRSADRSHARLSFGQLRLWIIHLLDPLSPAYNMPLAFRLEGRFEPASLRRALDEIVRRHEVLRTRFAEGESEPVQRIEARTSVSCPLVDLAALPALVREAAERRLASIESIRPFDLARGPVLRALLLRLGRTVHSSLVCIHHIAADGWSLEILLRELGTLYAAFVAGAPSPLAELAIQYADFAEWQRRWLSGERLEREIEYWRGRLADLPPLLELPSDRSRSLFESPAGARGAFEIAAPLVARLRSFGLARGATLFMTCLAAFQALLWRLSGSVSFAVGSPISGRSRRETEDLIGFFVNTLVVRCDLGGEPSFGSLTDQVRETVLAGQEHQDLPFEKLVEELDPERSLAHTPIFQQMFSFQSSALRSAGAGGPVGELRLVPLGSETGTARFDLTLEISDRGDRLGGVMRYRTDRFDPVTIARWAEHYDALLAGAMAAPDLRLGDLDLLGAAGRHQLIVEWNDSAAEGPGGACVHERIFAQAERTPDAIAIDSEGRALSYGELRRRAERVASALRTAGAIPEARVAVLLDRGIDLVVGLVGVLASGAAYVPLDPQYPQERLDLMWADSGAELALTEERLVPRLGGSLRPILLAEAATAGPGAAAPSGGTGQLAYVIYTSGSTGRPKGVSIEHRQVGALLDWTAHRFGREELARVVASTSVCFDLSAFELFGTLAAGGTVVLVENVLALAGMGFAGDPTLLNTVPSALSELLGMTALPGSLQVLNLAGEALTSGLARRIREATVARLENLYGPTETTTYSTGAVVRGSGEPTIGRPLAGDRGYVLDGSLRPVLPGSVGELYLGGAGVSRGYLGRPDLTAERFVPDGWSGERGARLYRTGDLVRHRGDGDLEHLGRADRQVKWRGFRIELGEIEVALASAPGVAEAAVALREGLGGDRQLVGYAVVPEAGAGEAELRAHLARALPRHMVPSFVVLLDRLPKTPNGKIDRKALPPPPEGLQALGETEGATSPIEELLAEIWRDVLGVAQVERRSNFFALGGHSLLAARLISRLRKVVGVDLELRGVFESPELWQQAQWVERRLVSREAPAVPPLEKTDRTGLLPLSFAQESLWFLDRLAPGSGAYNIPIALRWEGPLDLSALRWSAGELVRRHEALRTRYLETAEGPMQQVDEWRPHPVPEVDLQGLSGAAGREEARLARAEAAEPFDLERGPVLRTRVLRLGGGEHAVLSTMHHIASDGWSLELGRREMARLYADALGGARSGLPGPALQYGDFARWQRSAFTDEALAGEIEYWRRHLEDLPELLDLPTDRPRTATASGRGAVRRFSLSETRLVALRELGRRSGATLFMLLTSSVIALLGRCSGRERLPLGTPHAGRTREELEGVFGIFVNVLVLRGDLSGKASFETLVGRVREDTLQAFGHQDLPFEKLVQALAPQRSLAHSPLFQVMVAVQNRSEARPPGPTREPVGNRLSGLVVESGTTKFDLSFTFGGSGEGLAAEVEYSRDLFDGTTIGRWTEHLDQLLEAGLTEPGRNLWDLDLLGAAGRHQLIVEWNDSAAEGPGGACVHERIFAQAERTPDAIAIDAEGELLTYRGLRNWALDLAPKLRRAGAAPESVVAISMRRMPQLIAGILAVLEAGGAYLPLEPTLPRERIAQWFEDSGCRLLLVDTEGERHHAGLGVPALRIEAELGAVSTAYRSAVVSAHQTAYVIYTSGSTGRPKGVAVPHASLANHTLSAAGRYRLGPTDRVLQFASIAFDAAAEEIFPSLAMGGTLVLREEGALEPDRFLDEAERRAITVLDLPTAYWHEMAAAMAERRRTLAPCVRWVILGGEKALAARLSDWWSVCGASARLINTYGPTEATIVATRCELHPGCDLSGDPLIGRPIDNVRVVILDRDLVPEPLGVPGEIALGGAGLARGYLRHPDLTAASFVPDGTSKVPGSRLYRTGDLARTRPGGEVEYLGRIDRQVKLRGFRIELGEIEALLSQAPQVREAAVVVQESAGDRRLLGYVVPSSAGAETPEGDLRAFLRQRLPDYMVPHRIVPLERLPLTPNGKVDRRALSDRFVSATHSGHEEWGDAVELELGRILATTLGVPKVGPEEDFFALGGHSLLAVRLLAKIRLRFGADLPLAALFLHSTARRLGGLVRQKKPRLLNEPIVPLRPEGTRPPLFLFHPIGGSVLCYLDLVGSLGAEPPVFGLQAPVRSQGESGLESRAGEYLEAMLAVRPQGPYQLAGWSFGAVLALEVARQLLDRGESVSTLFLIEPSELHQERKGFLSRVLPGRVSRERLPGRQVRFFLSDLAALARKSVGAELRDLEEASFAEAWRVGLARGYRSGWLPADLDPVRLLERFQLFEANHLALLEYRPRPYPGPATLVLAGETGSEVRLKSWRRIAKAPLKVVRLPGDHYSLLRKPQVEALAERLAAELA